jgi:solute carrier family 8 (sodium/calcium exchanger)
VHADLWLLVILVVVTPNVVDLWEGLFTFFFFPVLVWVAYLADTKSGCFSEPEAKGSGARLVAVTREGRPVTADDVSRAYSVVKNAVTDGDEASAIRDLLSGPKSKAYHKLMGTSESPMPVGVSTRKASLGGALNRRMSAFDPGRVATADARGKISDGRSAVLSFEIGQLQLPAANGWCELLVTRTGALGCECSIKYRGEVLGSALPIADGAVTFPAYQDKKFIRLKMPTQPNPFVVFLEDPSLNARLGRQRECRVSVAQELIKGAGIISFEAEHLEVKESDGKVKIVVLRKQGNSKAVSCRIKTMDGSAVERFDYIAIDQRLKFAVGETRKELDIEIVDDGKYENDEVFRVVLSDPTGGASFSNPNSEAKLLAEVTILSDEEVRSKVDEVMAVINFDTDMARLGGEDWRTQFAEAVEFEFDGDGSLASYVLAFVAYLLALPFKLFFAVSPPPRIFDGWACFGVALVLIGALTAMIGDLANHVGCCLGISASTTAITLVALGTSLPDPFASMSAATKEPYADSSLGNITGSNSVNVFLGLGLPWAIAAFYWGSAGDAEAWHARYSNEPWYSPDMPVAFVVPAGKLAFSVGVFTACALVTLGTLMLRRATIGHELGGQSDLKYLTGAFFVFLWFAYIAISIMGG